MATSPFSSHTTNHVAILNASWDEIEPAVAMDLSTDNKSAERLDFDNTEVIELSKTIELKGPQVRQNEVQYNSTSADSFWFRRWTESGP